MADIEMTGDGRMNTENAAKYLGYAPLTLTVWRTRGQGPAYVKQGGVSYYKDDLDAYMRQVRVATAATA